MPGHITIMRHEMCEERRMCGTIDVVTLGLSVVVAFVDVVEPTVVLVRIIILAKLSPPTHL
jgi:hypothetical protein